MTSSPRPVAVPDTTEPTLDTRIDAIMRDLKMHPRSETPSVCARAEAIITDMDAELARLRSTLASTQRDSDVCRWCGNSGPLLVSP